jgi:putative transposase
MPNYRRAWIPGGTFFFTVAIADRRSTLLIDEIKPLRRAFATTMRTRPFRIDAIVVLPEHLHCVWTLPFGDADFATRWRQIKAAFSRELPKRGSVRASLSRKRERGLWQRRYLEHLIRDEADFNAHVDYVHVNPLKHGLVTRVADWRWSSFHRHVRAGVLGADWAGTGVASRTVPPNRP